MNSIFKSPRGAWVAAHLAPILLVVVACLQIVRVWRDDLTPWKGGGFGMFSSVDSGASRLIRIRARAGEFEFELQAPNLGAPRTLARNLPTESNLREYAEAVAGMVWVEMEGEKPDVGARPSSSAQEPLEAQDRIGRGLLERTGPSRLVPWAPGRGGGGRIWTFDDMTVSVHRPRFFGDTGDFALSPVRSMTVPGLSKEGAAEEMGVPLELLKFAN